MISIYRFSSKFSRKTLALAFIIFSMGFSALNAGPILERKRCKDAHELCTKSCQETPIPDCTNSCNVSFDACMSET